MNRLIPNFGGMEMPEVPPNVDLEFGKKSCGLLDKALGDLEQADYYDASGTAMFRVERIGTDMYNFRDLRSNKVYGINRLGDPTYFSPIGTQSEVVGKGDLKHTLENDFELLESLEKKEAVGLE